jgi:hypothetical protein
MRISVITRIVIFSAVLFYGSALAAQTNQIRVPSTGSPIGQSRNGGPVHANAGSSVRATNGSIPLPKARQSVPVKRVNGLQNVSSQQTGSSARSSLAHGQEANGNRSTGSTTLNRPNELRPSNTTPHRGSNPPVIDGTAISKTKTGALNGAQMNRKR